MHGDADSGVTHFLPAAQGGGPSTWPSSGRRAKKAETVREQQAQKPPPKSGGLPRLKAMLDRADAQQRDAERKLPRSERGHAAPPARCGFGTESMARELYR